jgi:hypothetical protein
MVTLSLLKMSFWNYIAITPICCCSVCVCVCVCFFCHFLDLVMVDSLFASRGSCRK